MYKEYGEGEAPEPMERLARLYRSVDGFVVVCGEYNHGIPPALKNLIDHFMSEYFWRPAGIACYSAGPFGGVRAAVQLRAVLAEVGLVTIPSMFPMSRVGKSFADDGKALDEAYERRIGKFFDELEWYAEALREQRRRGIPYE
jgi:NAD(P)H-dependent FMN reductase